LFLCEQDLNQKKGPASVGSMPKPRFLMQQCHLLSGCEYRFQTFPHLGVEFQLSVYITIPFGGQQ
jgi:hypothetical protein